MSLRGPIKEQVGDETFHFLLYEELENIFLPHLEEAH